MDMAKQYGVFRRRQALAAGYLPREIDALLDSGEWVRLRQGIYTTRERFDAASPYPRNEHLLAGMARRLAMSGDLVISHRSGALHHGIALLDDAPAEPDLTRHQRRLGRRHTAHDLFLGPVPVAHRVPGWPVVTAARAVADCGRYLGPDAAFATIESALYKGLDRAAVEDVLAACAGWPGTRRAMTLLALADQWSESVLESLARLWFLEQGLPEPLQQWSVHVGARFLARVDFVWPELRTVCEMDGQVKYAEDRDRRGETKDGPTTSNRPLWREKLREDGVRDVGLQVVRGYWSDGSDRGADLAERLRRAFARGVAEAGEPAYRLVEPTVRWDRPLDKVGRRRSSAS